MSLSALGFSHNVDDWLPPIDAWRIFACQRCEAQMRLPFPPSDRLCGDCRADERRVPEKTLEERLIEAGAPRRFAASTRRRWQRHYGPWDDSDELSRLIGWPRRHDDSSWLVMITGRGHGQRKAELATAILGAAMTADEHGRGLRGRWLSQPDWLRQIKASWNGGRGDQEELADPEHIVWQRAADAEVLFFEDLGEFGGFEAFNKTWWRRQVTHLLHHRERRLLPTIVTLNVDDWRQVGRIHPSLPARMDASLKILLEEDLTDV